MTTLSSLVAAVALAASTPITLDAHAALHPQDATPSVAPEKDSGVLDGPEVPKKGLDSSRPFTGGKPPVKDGAKDGQRPPAPMGSKPAIEQNAFFAAIDAMAFTGELKESVDAARAEFVARVKAWEETAGAKRKKLFEERKRASSAEPPSEEFKKGMAEIEASRPKLVELQQRVFGMLSEEEGAKLKDAFEAELKRVRDEIARKAEADRKRKQAEKKEGSQDPAAREGKPSGDRPTDPKS
jgi:hypothetical protein